MKILVGSSIYCVPSSGGLDAAICDLIASEEHRVLALRRNGLTADEDILIHLVRMYIARWALPAVEIEAGRLDPSALEKVRRRFWLCMFGRGADDLFDADSRFFSLSDSILLTSAYASLLKLDPETPGGADILRRTAESMRVVEGSADSLPLDMRQIREDVCRRVSYFLSPASEDERAAELLRRYVGVLLGRCDLDDCLADGSSGAASTLLSREMHRVVADPEGKIHLNTRLLDWYSTMDELLSREAQELQCELSDFGAHYAADVISAALRQWRQEAAAGSTVQV